LQFEDVSTYDQWYQKPKGRWIGNREYRMMRNSLHIDRKASILDVGCGTGYFTRRFAEDQDGRVVGIDPDERMIAFAAEHACASDTYVVAAGESIPFPDGSFDHVVAITSLCFIADEVAVIRELARVARKSCAIGLLNRRSLLYLQKGRGRNQGDYVGAHWHTKKEAVSLAARADLVVDRISTGIVIPSGSPFARMLELMTPRSFPWGGFLLVTGHRMDKQA